MIGTYLLVMKLAPFNLVFMYLFINLRYNPFKDFVVQ